LYYVTSPISSIVSKGKIIDIIEGKKWMKAFANLFLAWYA
jgi:hypothetical protein